MRLRHFLITAIVLLFVSLFSLWTHNYLAEQDKVAIITSLIKQTAVTLSQVDWANHNHNDFQRIEYILSAEIGENELNRFFILRDTQGNILYKSRVAAVLALEEIAPSPTWIRLIKNQTEFLIYNLMNERYPDRILQVGIILHSDKDTGFTSFTLFILFFSIGLLGTLSSWLLSGILFSPISKVGRFLATATLALDKRGTLPNVPKELFMHLGKGDELRTLTEDLDSLLNKINNNYKMSRLWAAQMAHELKTPLSQLLLHLETTSDTNEPSVKKSITYIYNIKDTINAFLDWAELENNTHSPQKREDIHIPTTVRGMIAMMSEEDKARIKIQTAGDLTLSVNPHHFAQLVQNLMSNALKYSQNEVIVDVTHTSIKVIDSGNGIPHDVLEKVGDPFNFGNSKLQKKGHGLGLAWIKTICALYDWKPYFYSSDKGTTISVEFTKTASSSTPIIRWK